MAKASKPRRSASAADSPHMVPGKLGHTLSEFLPLKAAEKKLVSACRTGVFANFGEAPPQRATTQNRIRGEFLRFLILGGDEEAPVREVGVQVWGAYIKGEVDLSNCVIKLPIRVRNSFFDSRITIADASIILLSLSGSVLPGIFGDRMVCTGGIFLDNGFQANGEVRLMGVSIGGPVSCIGGAFSNPGEKALSCDQIRIGGSLFLRDKFTAVGEVRLIGARINGNFDCGGGQFESQRGPALVADLADVAGSVYLHHGFSANGAVRLAGIKIRGQLDCANGSFENPTGGALICDGAEIAGHLILRSTAVSGGVSMLGARVGTLTDDEGSWGDWVDLEGFRYERIAAGPTDAASRIRWLRKQTRILSRAPFYSQAWEHLVRLFREMGHVEDARLVSIEKQRHMRKLGLVGNRIPREGISARFSWFERGRIWVLNRLARALHRLYGALAGYGYRPSRTLAWMIAGWLVGTAVYTLAEARGLFGPTAPLLQTSQQFARCGAPGEAGAWSWTRCPALPPEHTKFSPSIYSLDVILPLIDLKQEADWAPIVEEREDLTSWYGFLVRGLMWVQILFGWITSLLLASAVGRLIQKD